MYLRFVTARNKSEKMKKSENDIQYYFGRRPKQVDDFEDLNRLGDEGGFEEYEEEEEDEEVDFDNPAFKRDQIWTDYAEDLDYDE